MASWMVGELDAGARAAARSAFSSASRHARATMLSTALADRDTPRLPARIRSTRSHRAGSMFHVKLRNGRLIDGRRRYEREPGREHGCVACGRSRVSRVGRVSCGNCRDVVRRHVSYVGTRRRSDRARTGMERTNTPASPSRSGARSRSKHALIVSLGRTRTRRSRRVARSRQPRGDERVVGAGGRGTAIGVSRETTGRTRSEGEPDLASTEDDAGDGAAHAVSSGGGPGREYAVYPTGSFT